MCFSFPGTLVFPDELVSEHLADCRHSKFRKDFSNVKLFNLGIWENKDNKDQLFVVEEFLVVLDRACLWGQCRSVLYVFTLQSQPLWFIPVNAVQPDIYSLTHRLFLPFHHLWICCCHVCMWVEKQASRPRFIPFMCSPRSWAASVKPSTPPRRLWRRNMLDVSFTKTNRKSRFLTEVTCLVHSVGIHNMLYRV